MESYLPLRGLKDRGLGRLTRESYLDLLLFRVGALLAEIRLVASITSFASLEFLVGIAAEPVAIATTTVVVVIVIAALLVRLEATVVFVVARVFLVKSTATVSATVVIVAISVEVATIIVTTFLVATLVV